MKITIKIILFLLNNSFFNSFMQMKNEKAKLKLQKIQRALKIQTKNSLRMKIVVIYSNFTFRIEVKKNLSIKF